MLISIITSENALNACPWSQQLRRQPKGSLGAGTMSVTTNDGMHLHYSILLSSITNENEATGRLSGTHKGAKLYFIPGWQSSISKSASVGSMEEGVAVASSERMAQGPEALSLSALLPHSPLSLPRLPSRLTPGWVYLSFLSGICCLQTQPMSYSELTRDSGLYRLPRIQLFPILGEGELLMPSQGS